MTELDEHAVLKSRIDQVLDEFVTAEAQALEDIDTSLAPVADQLRVATEHGKRFRAAFCYWGWRGAGQPDSEALVRAAGAIELVHAAAVVHDDLIDRSRTRHGRPTAHIALRDVFTRPARRKPSARALALLTGNLLISMAGQLFTTCGLPSAYLSRARPVWGVLARELVAGECLEILRTGAEPDPEASVKVIRYKTAKYTVEHPLHIGALLAGAPPGLLEAYSSYGLPLGEAFQLRDDLMGLFGDPARTGKNPADDLAGNRPTALMAHAMQSAAPGERRELHHLLGHGKPSEQQVERVRAIAHRTGAVARVEDMIAARLREAHEVLADADLTAEARRALSGLATFATARRH
ncbi:polyprenyl synthetase family protein [Streptomyces decoyicus]|uniref:polyprenyl synthetase family protein n=1 Tax=Streptomyces decoyicus TaxID=249567 RepID=UPI0004AAA15F|nr:polyprenyl synthetase family protein [Streptomyces decoyicus]KOG41122.1 polyprenyl synthetase [Streptomyces decoyicus]